MGAVSLVVLAALPALVLRATDAVLPVPLATFLFGLGIVAAAFAMSWGAEAAEHDVPRAFALIVVALLAVLPEYAVDIVFAWKAGRDPAFASYAAANMTGSNRLLLGLGWPVVVVLGWVIGRESVVRLDRTSASGVVFLGLATGYSFVLPFKASVSLVDSAVLAALFAAYVAVAARTGLEEPELVGPAAVIGGLPTGRRRIAIAGLFGLAAVTVAVSAEPFADGLVRTGRTLGVDEFLLVQWLAPLASEAPEFLVAALLALRGKAVSALALLLSAQINQWTLLVGSLPIAYSLGAGRLGALPLDDRQVAEVLLTAAQGLFGVGVLASMSLSLGKSALLGGLFIAQLVLGGVLRAGLRDHAAAMLALFVFGGLYVVIAVPSLVAARRTVAHVVRAVMRPPEPRTRERGESVTPGSPEQPSADPSFRS